MKKKMKKKKNKKTQVEENAKDGAQMHFSAFILLFLEQFEKNGPSHMNDPIDHWKA